jgi:hypothetical protein
MSVSRGTSDLTISVKLQSTPQADLAIACHLELRASSDHPFRSRDVAGQLSVNVWLAAMTNEFEGGSRCPVLEAAFAAQ